MSALDDMPTPELGSPVQAEPRRWRRRRASEEPIGTVEQRVRALEGDRKLARGALVAALGSLGALLIWALNAREAAGYQRARAEVLVKTVERLEVDLATLRSDFYRSPWAPARRSQPSSAPPAQPKDSDP